MSHMTEQERLQYLALRDKWEKAKAAMMNAELAEKPSAEVEKLRKEAKRLRELIAEFRAEA